MDNDKLKELRRLAEQATPGEWVVDVRVGCIAVYRSTLKINCMGQLNDDDKVVYYSGVWDGDRWNVRSIDTYNASYIAAANPVTSLELLDEIERLKKLEHSFRHKVMSSIVEDYQDLSFQFNEQKAEIERLERIQVKDAKRMCALEQEIESLKCCGNCKNMYLSYGVMNCHLDYWCGYDMGCKKDKWEGV